MKPRDRQTTADIFLVRPARFGPNAQTAASNAYQKGQAEAPADVVRSALGEFDAMVELLSSAGVRVIVFDDTPSPDKPDAIFPNNWITTHDDGRVILYPMQAENRRHERREDIVESLSTRHDFHVSQIIDLAELADFERRGRYLEGTGSMVLDRVNRIAYAALSPRTDPEVLAEFGQLADYELTTFDTVGAGGLPIYHTNVMLSLGRTVAVICAASITHDDQRRAVLRRIEQSGKQVLEIDAWQTENFAGNLIELSSASGEPLWAISRRAQAALRPAQQELLEASGRLVVLPIDTIEAVGGGSVRCMIAEIFLPRHKGN